MLDFLIYTFLLGILYYIHQYKVTFSEGYFIRTLLNFFHNGKQQNLFIQEKKEFKRKISERETRFPQQTTRVPEETLARYLVRHMEQGVIKDLFSSFFFFFFHSKRNAVSLFPGGFSLTMSGTQVISVSLCSLEKSVKFQMLQEIEVRLKRRNQDELD